MSSKRVAVIGAGISGLACAYELQRAGLDVTVFERDAQVGGRMSSRIKDGFIFDLGADHLCDLYDDIKAYGKEFGIPWEKMRFLAYRIVKRGKIIRFDDAIGRWSKFRLALQYLLVGKKIGNFFDMNELVKFDDENGYDFILRRCGREVADYFVDPFASTYQFHRATEISKGALLGILRSIKHDEERWHLHRTQGGMQALPQAFASRLQVRLNTPVQELTAAENGVQVDGERFDLAVIASTPKAALRFYKNSTEAQRALLEKTAYAATVSLSFRVARSQLPEVAVVWVPYVENPAISGYVNQAMKGEETTRDHKTLLSVWLHEDFARSIMRKSDEEIFRLVKTELLKVCPWFSSAEELENHDLQRWPEAMPKFAQGHLTAVQKFLRDDQGAQNVFLCGDYLNAPWTEGALRLGKRVAAQAIKRLQGV